MKFFRQNLDLLLICVILVAVLLCLAAVFKITAGGVS